MGLFGFNAEKKLAKARENLQKGFFYESRMAFEEILKREDVDGGIRSQAKEGWRSARQGMIAEQMEEARRLIRAEERDSALESLQTVVEIADTDLDCAEAKAMIAELTRAEEGAADALRGLEVPVPAAVEMVEDADGDGVGFGESPDDLLEVYLGAMPEEIAETYRGLGTEFRDAFLMLQQGEPAEAARLFESVPAERKGDPVVRLEWGQALLLLDRNEESLELLQNIALPPALERRRAEMATILLDRLGRRSEAEAEARRLYAAHGQEAEVALFFGDIMVGHGQFDDALAALKPFIPAGDPPEVIALAARAHLAKGEIEEGKGLLEQALEIFFQGPGLGGRAPRFPIAAARELLSFRIQSGAEMESVRSLAQHLINNDPGSSEAYLETVRRYAESIASAKDPAGEK